MKKPTELQIERYDDRRDRDAVLILDNQCFRHGAGAWDELKLESNLQRPSVVGRVAYVAGKLVGFIFFDTDAGGGEFELLRVAVAGVYRRRGIGSELVNIAIDGLNHITGFSYIDLVMDEKTGFFNGHENVACLFFESCGFNTVVDWDNDDDDDGFLSAMGYRLPGGETYKNRIKKFLKN